MKPTAPYYLAGEAGKSLTEVQISLADLCCYNATLSLRSLDVDTLTFQILGSRSKVIPDDGQWISLYDGTGTRLFSGIAKRTYTHPQGIYSYEVSNVYLGLQQSVLLTPSGAATPTNPNPNRPYVVCDQGSLAARITFLLSTAAAEGLPIKAPASLPPMFDVPKQAFRASSISGALEDTLKWLPDVATRMDYTTSPPTLRFYTRTASAPTTINLDMAGHHATAAQLAAWPEARAAYVAFVYAERSGNTVVNYRIQAAGDNSAEARKKISVYLSGAERTDMLVSDALMVASSANLTANAALAGAKAAVDSQNAAAQAAYNAAVASIPAGADTTVSQYFWTAVQAAYPTIFNYGIQYSSAAGYVTLYTSITYGVGTPSYATNSFYFSGVSIPSGWIVASGTFTAAQLATAGATVSTVTLAGRLRGLNGSQGWGTGAFAISGWTSATAASSSDANNYYRQYSYKDISVQVTILSKAPSVIRAALQAAAAATLNTSTAAAITTTGATSFIDNAQFVPAPPNLAEDYFARQDWTPFKGSLSLDPKAADLPEPGDFINIAADTTPTEWASMAAPVSELSIDLSTGAAEVKIGPSPRMDFQSLIDRLRIPAEDNYQAG